MRGMTGVGSREEGEMTKEEREAIYQVFKLFTPYLEHVTSAHEKDMKTRTCRTMRHRYLTRGRHSIHDVKEGVGRIKGGWMARRQYFRQ